MNQYRGNDSHLEQARRMWKDHISGPFAGGGGGSGGSHLEQPQFVYVAIGSHSSEPKSRNEDQEWPLWLERFNAENPHCAIKVILIDPEYERQNPQLPHQLRSVTQTPYGRVLVAERGNISFLVIPHTIDMMNAQDGSCDAFNIIALAQEIANLCSQNPLMMAAIDCFTGHDLYQLRGSVTVRTPHTFLLGSEHNNDSGCFRDFSQPGTCPLIVPNTDPMYQGMFMFMTPATVDPLRRRMIMSLRQGQGTFTELSIRMWIEKECCDKKRHIVGELLLHLRMFKNVERGFDIKGSLENIESSLQRCASKGITKYGPIQGPDDVLEYIRRLLTMVATQYAKDLAEFQVEIDTLIAFLITEENIHKYGEHVNTFFKQHFPQYLF